RKNLPCREKKHPFFPAITDHGGPIISVIQLCYMSVITPTEISDTGATGLLEKGHCPYVDKLAQYRSAGQGILASSNSNFNPPSYFTNPVTDAQIQKYLAEWRGAFNQPLPLPTPNFQHNNLSAFVPLVIFPRDWSFKDTPSFQGYHHFFGSYD